MQAQVGQPLLSLARPLVQLSAAQAMAGQAMGVGVGAGGTAQTPPPSMGVLGGQSHGTPAAQAHPVLVVAEPPLLAPAHTNAPPGPGAMPQWFAVSAVQLSASVCALHTSRTVVVVLPWSLQLQTQGSATPPSGDGAPHAQAHVEPELQPSPPSSQLQAHGGQISPGAHAGHAQAHAPPEPVVVPPSPAAPPEQSHSTAGTTPLWLELIGLTHAQSVPPRSLV